MNTIYTDAPEVRKLAAIAFPSYTGRKFRVTPFSGPMRLDSNWSGGSRDWFVFINLVTGQTMPVPENGTPFTDTIGRLTALPENVVLIEHTISCGKDMGITVHVAPENMNRLALPAPVELTWEEKVVLSATRSLKSSYNGVSNYRQREAMERTGITASEYDTAKASLIGKAMLNRAGAITDAGRNAIGWADLHNLARPALTA